MRILTEYTIRRVLATTIATFLIFCFLVMAVETFMHLDSYMTDEGMDFTMMLYYAFSSLANYYILLLSVSVLFAVSYFLSDMSANNELISLYGAGISRVRLVIPILMLSIALTSAVFLFNESIGLAWKDLNLRLSAEYFGQSGTSDPTNISLYDEETGYLIHARSYNKRDLRLFSPVVVKSTDGRIRIRIEAGYAQYGDGGWTFQDARVVRPVEDGIESFFSSTYTEDGLTVAPELFESQNMRMETMDAQSAYDYLSRLKKVNPVSYQEKMTDFISRFFEPFSIFIMMSIALMMNYTFKKNILLFSIVQSLVIAVVYYVSDMVFSIVSRQGMAPAYAVAVFPFILTIVSSFIVSKVGKRI